MTHASDDPSPSVPARKPSLEDLLRLKRAERPDAAFWQDFERGLRQKQLAAIIEPRPWWLGLALLGRRLSALGLPVSAGAAALLAVMVVRTQAPFGQSAGPVEFGPGAVATADPFARPAAPAPALAAAAPGVTPAAAETPSANGPESVLAVASASVAAALPAAALPDQTAPAPEAASTSLALPLEVPVAERPAAPTLSQLAIARNLAVVKAEEPELLAAAAPGLVSAAPAPAASLTTEEQTLRMVVFNPRHARALVALADGPAAEAGGGGLAHLRDRLARSLDHSDALYGSVSRLGVGGDRLSLSF